MKRIIFCLISVILFYQKSQSAVSFGSNRRGYSQMSNAERAWMDGVLEGTRNNEKQRADTFRESQKNDKKQRPLEIPVLTNDSREKVIARAFSSTSGESTVRYTNAEVNKIGKMLGTPPMDSPEILCKFGLLYLKGAEGFPLKKVRGIELLVTSSEKGYPYAFMALGRCLFEGDGVKQDWLKAFQFWEKAREHGATAEGRNNVYDLLGFCYQKGIGTIENPKKAAEMFKISAEGGGEVGLYQFALCLFSGNGVEKDEQKAVQLMNQSGEKDYPEALAILGIWACAQDNPSAAVYFKKAADRNLLAKVGLAICYQNGFGAQKDMNEAAKLLAEVSREDPAEAQQAVATLLSMMQ